MRGFVIVFFFFLLRIDKITESFDVFFRRVSRFRQQFPRSLHMSWSFSIDEANKQKDSLQGKDGEYYFVPGTKPKWSGPQKLVGRSKTLPLFPRNSVLLPEGVEYLTIYDIRFRQMLNDVEVGGYFGCVYVSPEYSKYGLVGTVARVNHIERLDDGAMYIKITGEKRFFIREISQDRPYPISKVQYLFDGLDNAQQTRQLERKLFHQLRHSMKLLKRLYPDNNYTLSDTVYRNRPYFAAIDTKTTRHTPTPIFDPNVDSIQRQASFSYGVMNLLKTDAVTRLLVLQESILDQRLQRLCKVLLHLRYFCFATLLSTVLTITYG